MSTDQLQMLEELLNLDSGLNYWEIEFIDDLSQYPKFIELSERQAEKLIQLWEKHVN